MPPPSLHQPPYSAPKTKAMPKPKVMAQASPQMIADDENDAAFVKSSAQVEEFLPGCGGYHEGSIHSQEVHQWQADR